MKKIHSEISMTDDLFKVKICTTDKRHPDTIYIEMGSYISPNEEQETYTDTIAEISKRIKSYAKSSIKSSTLFNHDIIMVTDIADERMKVGKKSYLDIQLHMKPTNDSLIRYNNFKDLTTVAYDTYLSDVLKYVKTSISENGFSCSKLKK